MTLNARELSVIELERSVRTLLHLAADAGARLPGLLLEDPLSGVPDICFSTPEQAVEHDPYTYGNVHSVKWKLRNRERNGLLAAGAVVEHYNGPRAERKRPRLTIVHRQWVAHKRGLSN